MMQIGDWKSPSGWRPLSLSPRSLLSLISTTLLWWTRISKLYNVNSFAVYLEEDCLLFPILNLHHGVCVPLLTEIDYFLSCML